MASIRSIVGDAPEAAADARPAAGLHNAWMLALERAQLARQSRQASAAVASAALAGNASETRAPEALAGNAIETRAPARIASPTLPTGDDRLSARVAVAPHRAAAASPRATIEAPHRAQDISTPGEPAGGEAQIVRRESSKAVPPASPSPPQRSLAVAWPVVHVHARWNGTGVEMWVRDASLDETARSQLAARLRAQLRRGGWELEQLTVNGEQINSEEILSWPSKR